MSAEYQHFTYDTKQWLGEYVQGLAGPLRLGGKKHKAVGEGSSLAGRLSCLQLYEAGLTPSQVPSFRN